MIDRVSLDLLYLQIIAEIDLGWIQLDSETQDILSGYEAKKQKREVSLHILYIYFATGCNKIL